MESDSGKSGRSGEQALSSRKSRGVSPSVMEEPRGHTVRTESRDHTVRTESMKWSGNIATQCNPGSLQWPSWPQAVLPGQPHGLTPWSLDTSPRPTPGIRHTCSLSSPTRPHGQFGAGVFLRKQAGLRQSHKRKRKEPDGTFRQRTKLHAQEKHKARSHLGINVANRYNA